MTRSACSSPSPSSTRFEMSSRSACESSARMIAMQKRSESEIFSPPLPT